MTVCESWKGMSLTLLLLLLYALVWTIRTGAMYFILSSMLLHTGGSAIGTGGNYEWEYSL